MGERKKALNNTEEYIIDNMGILPELIVRLKK